LGEITLSKEGISVDVQLYPFSMSTSRNGIPLAGSMGNLKPSQYTDEQDTATNLPLSLAQRYEAVNREGDKESI